LALSLVFSNGLLKISQIKSILFSALVVMDENRVNIQFYDLIVNTVEVK